MVPSLSWGAQPNRPHHNIRRGATRRCLSASFPTSPPIRLRRRPLNSPWLSLIGQGSACKAPCTLCFFLEAVHNVLSASDAILQRVIAQCHAVHDCGKPSLCHKFATLSSQKPAIQSKTAHHTAKCNALFLLEILGGPKEDRTPDLCIANAALSQLSYRPWKSAHYREPKIEREAPSMSPEQARQCCAPPQAVAFALRLRRRPTPRPHGPGDRQPRATPGRRGAPR